METISRDRERSYGAWGVLSMLRAVESELQVSDRGMGSREERRKQRGDDKESRDGA